MLAAALDSKVLPRDVHVPKWKDVDIGAADGDFVPPESHLEGKLVRDEHDQA